MEKPKRNLQKLLPQTPERTIIEKRDKALIRSACNGDHLAFGELVRLYENRVRALGFSFFKNEIDTDDFIQEVFITSHLLKENRFFQLGLRELHTIRQLMRLIGEKNI